MALSFGGLAFALSPFLGRALGGRGGRRRAARRVHREQLRGARSRPSAAIAVVTPWYWTSDHLPLAGQYDWVSLVPVAIFAVVLLAVGVEAFARRDLGATSRVRLPAMPAVLLGEDGPVGRSFGERLPMALGWGIGLGIFGLADRQPRARAGGFAAQVARHHDRRWRAVFPGMDIDHGRWLPPARVRRARLHRGRLRAATLVGGWASDETSGRLEVVLASPLARRGWFVRSGLGRVRRDRRDDGHRRRWVSASVRSPPAAMPSRRWSGPS